MDTPEYHIFVCNSFRLSGAPQGVCNKKGATDLLGMLENEIVDRGLNAMVSATGCLKLCEKGPVVVVYPQGWWYVGVDEDRMEEILDTMEEGTCVEAYLAG